MSEVVRTSAPNTQHAVRSTEAARRNREVYDGEIVDDNELYSYITPPEDIIDAEIIHEPLAIESGEELSAAPELQLTFIDQSQDARDFARDRADARLAEELGEGGRFRRIIKGIWKGNIAKDFYRQRYIREAQAEIENSQNILTHETTHVDGMRAMEATIARFQSQYDEAVHGDAGERKEELAADSEIAISLKDLIRRYADGELDDRALLEERTRTIEAYREAHGDEALGEGLVRIDNMLDIAQAVRGAVEHGQSLDRVLENMKIITGESRAGVRTEAHYNMVDKTIEKLGRSRVGSLVGPETLITAVTVTASLLRLGSHKAVGALAMTVAPGIAGGLFAGLRENKRVKDERTQHAREMAQGKEFMEGDRRREEMEAARYETVSASDLLEAIRERFETEDGLSSDEALQAALDELAALETRIRLSDSQQMDLISYSATSAVEEERLALDIARAQAKTILDHRLDDETRTRLGVSSEGSLQDLLDERSHAFTEYAEQDISEKDRAFRRLKARRVATAAATGAITGLLIGGAFQEGVAAFDDTRQGLLEQLWNAQDHPIDGEQHQTLAYGLVHGDNSHELTTHHNPSDHFESYKTGEHANVSVSDDHTLVDNHDGTISLIDRNGTPAVEHLSINPDGTMPQDSLDALAQRGMIVENLSHPVETVTTETKQVDLNQFVANHHAETTPITRDLWYDNDTPAPVFDRNEIGLQWLSGDKGEGLQANGDIRMNVGPMSADGSFHGDQAAAWRQEANAGNLKLAISASDGVQAEPFMVDIKADGSIDIPHDGPAAKFFGEENGHAVFNGKYAEVVQLTGKDDAGVEHVRPLATLVGNDNVGPLTDIVQVHQTHIESAYKITTNGYDTHEQQATFTEMAPVIPVVARRSMEAVRGEALALSEYTPNYYGYTGGERYMSAAEARERDRIRQAETSPRLLRQPDQDLNPHEELTWYRQLTQRNMGAEYVRSIDAAIAASPELSHLPSNLKAIIKMPVNAAGKAESENIYSVLSAYAAQDREALDDSMMLLHVNWFDDAMTNPEKRQTIERTKSEIARAKVDFPHLKVATVETEWKRSEIGEDPIIGHVSRRLNDAALFAAEKAMREGRIADDQDILLIRNDADPKGISRHYIKRYMQEADRHKETDVFTGLTTFDNTKATSTPGLVYVGNFMQSLHYFSTAREKGVHTGGANFGVRASTFAAVGGIGFGGGTGAGSDDVEIGRRIVDARTAEVLPYVGAGLSGYVANWRQGRKRSGTYASAATPTNKQHRRIGRSVSGARIDTDSDREEALYQQGIPIIDTWNPENGFDAKGYSARDARLGKRSKESAFLRPTELVEKIRHDMEGSLSSYSPAVIRSALTFAFSRPGLNASEAYKLTIKGHARNGTPIYDLQFTKQGRDHLLKHLTRNSNGRFESYGTRKNRQMYGQTGRKARAQATDAPLLKIA